MEGDVESERVAGSVGGGSKAGLSRRQAVKRLGGMGAVAAMGGLAGVARARPAPGGKPADAGRAAAPSSPDRPNVLFIMTDDHVAKALSCYDDRYIDTPNLDRLAERGMRFENCFVPNSLCGPSRATTLTGKHAHVHGVLTNTFRDNPGFDGSQWTFPQALREAGYRTALIGKWHLKNEPTGFDHWNVLPGQGRYYDPVLIEMGERRTHDGYVSDVITDLCIDVLEERLTPDRPFLLMCHHKAPHRGWRPGPGERELFTDQRIPVPPTFNDDYMNRASAAAHADMRIADMPDWRDEQPDGLTERERKHWNYQRYMKSYLATVASFDAAVGRLLDHLDAAGRGEDTLVVYTSDNGMFLGEHGWYDKRFMYEPSIRVPLIVRHPRAVPAGAVQERIVSNLDFAATFLDYAGVDVPADVQGESFRPLLEGRDAPERYGVFYYHYYEYPGPHRVRPHYGIRTDRHKLIHYYTIGEWELFDLRRDPYELNSVYDVPAYAGLVRDMTAELRRQRARYDDTTGAPVSA